jgi:DNA-binding CsgD family transcriptional regulator
VASPAIARCRGDALPDGPLLERESEVAQLTECVDAALAGRGSTLVIGGEAGIGKSALLTCAVEVAVAAGMRVLVARGWQRERERPLGVARQLFEPGQLGDGGDPDAVLHGLYRMTDRIGAEQPLLMAIDDAHWADAASIDYLAFLARRVADLPVLIAYCARPHEGLRDRLPDATEPQLRHRVLELRGLGAAAVSALVGRVFGEEQASQLAGACQRASCGNPFLLHELLRELQASAIPPGAAGAAFVAQLAPQSIARAVLRQLAGLGDPHTRLAMAICVLGPRTELRHAAELARLDIDAAGDAADALVAVSLLHARRPLEFVHPVVAMTLYASIASAQRSAAHLGAARMLARDAITPEMIGPHLLATEPANDPWVVGELRAAADRAAARGDPQTAWRYLTRAKQEPPPPEQRASVLLQRGTAAARIGDDSARDELRRAYELADDTATTSAAAIELAQAMSYAGDVPGAVELLKVTLERLDGKEPELAGRLAHALLLTAGASPASGALIEDWIDDARLAWRRGWWRPAPAVLSVLAIDSIAAGSAQDAVELARLALRDGLLIAELGADSPAVRFATCALALADRPELASRELDAAAAQAQECGSQRGLAAAWCFRAFSRYHGGDVAGAETDARAALELADGPGLQLLRPVLSSTLIDCLSRRGEIGGAAALLDALAIDALDPDCVFTQLLRASAARLRIAQRRPSDALAHVAVCENWAARWTVTNPAWISWRSTAALAHNALGERERALELAAAELRAAHAFGGHRSCAIAMRTVGAITGGERGVELLREAARRSALSGARLVHAETLAALGGALRRGGRPRDARTPLKQALELAHRCGATGVAAQIQAELTATGARPRRVALSGVESLTASERRVAGLAAEGLTNREIARALFVSVRTVETHLTHAYQKLDIASRGQLEDAMATSAVAL